MYSLVFGILLPLMLLFFTVYWSIKNGIGPMPSSRKQKQLMIRSIPGDMEGSIFELGSGWGSLAFLAARRFPQCRIIGYENSPIPFLFSKIIYRSSNLRYERKDFLHVSLSGAAVILCYLYPGGMERLKPKLETELKPRSWIITNTFAVPGWQPHAVAEVNDVYRSKIYVYKL